MHKNELTVNERIAVYITTHIGTMWAAYIFAVIGIGSLVGVITNNTVLALSCGAVSSYFLQLVLLPIIMVGQNIQSRHAERRAKKDLQVDVKTFNEIELIKGKLDSIYGIITKTKEGKQDRGTISIRNKGEAGGNKEARVRNYDVLSPVAEIKHSSSQSSVQTPAKRHNVHIQPGYVEQG